MKVAANGGPPRVLTPNQDDPRGITTDARYVYWVTYGTWSASNEKYRGGVWKIPKAHGPAILLAGDRDRATAIAIDARHIYWTEENQVCRMHIDGGEPEVIAASQEMPLFLALDADNVYWTTLSFDGTHGMVMKMAK